jgi:hypothetical protein
VQLLDGMFEMQGGDSSSSQHDGSHVDHKSNAEQRLCHTCRNAAKRQALKLAAACSRLAHLVANQHMPWLWRHTWRTHSHANYWLGIDGNQHLLAACSPTRHGVIGQAASNGGIADS